MTRRRCIGRGRARWPKAIVSEYETRTFNTKNTCIESRVTETSSINVSFVHSRRRVVLQRTGCTHMYIMPHVTQKIYIHVHMYDRHPHAYLTHTYIHTYTYKTHVHTRGIALVWLHIHTIEAPNARTAVTLLISENGSLSLLPSSSSSRTTIARWMPSIVPLID